MVSIGYRNLLSSVKLDKQVRELITDSWNEIEFIIYV